MPFVAQNGVEIFRPVTIIEHFGPPYEKAFDFIPRRQADTPWCNLRKGLNRV